MHGRDSFSFYELEQVAPDALLVAEQRWIDHCGSAGKAGYNVNPTAGSRLGTVCSDATRKRLSRAGTGRKHSAETKAKMSASQAGRVTSAETRAKISKARAGYKVSKPKSAHFTATIAAANAARVWTAESRAKSSAARLTYLSDKAIETINGEHAGDGNVV
jgi:hypothetical protein